MPRLRRLTEADLDDVVAVEEAAQAVPWTREALAEELRHPDAVVVGVDDDQAEGGLIAYVVWRQNLDERWVLNVATHPRARRRGLARALLRAWNFEAAERSTTSLWLEVREGNAAARALYAQLGYVGVGRRPGYYAPEVAGGPREAAILMRAEVPVVDVQGA